MLKRTRKRSAQITLVLLGTAALAACDDQSERRDLYASKQDCVQDWGDETKCEPAPNASTTTGRSHTGGGYFWGPLYSGNSYRSSGAGNGALGAARSGSRAIGSGSISRGGFGSSASSHSSSGS
jgi:uncharacterized protein YgiB involved in biofilm formation